MIGGRQVLTPQDPQGRGTWIAANGAGLVFALLNVYDGSVQRADAGQSRGGIVPLLADATTIDEVSWRTTEIPEDTFAPCHLLMTDGERLVQVRIGRGPHHVQVRPLDAKQLFTSSSLGDALVDGPRRLLFEQMTGAAADLDRCQDAYHAHRWRDRPALSVHMSRPDACTVSTTVVEVSALEVRMTYSPAQCDAGTPVGLIIDREHIRHDAPARARRKHAAV